VVGRTWLSAAVFRIKELPCWLEGEMFIYGIKKTFFYFVNRFPQPLLDRDSQLIQQIIPFMASPLSLPSRSDTRYTECIDIVLS
jgi:hypothetical protein